MSYGWSKKSLWLFWNIQDSVKPDLVCTERFDSGTLDLTAVDSTYPTHMLSDVVHQRCRHQSIIWGSACLNVDRKLYPECIIIIIHSFIHPSIQLNSTLSAYPSFNWCFVWLSSPKTTETKNRKRWHCFLYDVNEVICPILVGINWFHFLIFQICISKYLNLVKEWFLLKTLLC